MGPPISSVAWSADFVAQTLEVLAICLRDGELFWLKPLHAESLRVGAVVPSVTAELAVVMIDGPALLTTVCSAAPP